MFLSSVALLAPRAAQAQDAPAGEAPAVAPAGEPAAAPEASPAAEPAPPPPPPPAQPGYAPGYGPPPGSYPPPGFAPPPVQEHSGFFLRLTLGGGYTSLSGSGGTNGTTYGGSSTVSGSGPALGVALGGAVLPNLALFGDFIFADMEQPTVSAAGYSSKSTGSVGVGGFGGGVIYYFEPINLYISGAVAVINAVFQDKSGNMTDQTNNGFGFEGVVGKEWWVSQHWGLGAAAQFFGAAGMKDKNDSSVVWNAKSFNVLFSATFF